MKITLRKANALQLAIGEAVKNIDVETDVKINEFQDGEAEIALSLIHIWRCRRRG